MAKKSHIDQIKQLKERDEFNPDRSLYSRLAEIDNLLRSLEEHNITDIAAILKYIPLATVACIEGVFRSIVKELIDGGKPYIDRISELEKKHGIKLSFDMLVEIQSRNFTVGELVAHAMPCSRFEDINNVLSTLLGSDFSDALKKFKRPTIFDQLSMEFEYFRNNHQTIFRDVTRLFELRHILAHEIARNLVIDKGEILRCYSNGQFFIQQMNHFIQNLLDADVTENIEALIEKYMKKAASIDEEMQKVFAKKTWERDLFDIFFENKREETHNKTVEAWKLYRQEKSGFAASQVIGANWSTLAYYKSYIQTTRDMIENFNKTGTFY